MRYAPEIKALAKRLIREGGTIREVAAALRINYYTLWEWVTPTRETRRAERRARVSVRDPKKTEYKKNYARHKTATDPGFATRLNLHCLVGKAIRTRGKGRRASEILGCTPRWLAERWDGVYSPGWERQGLVICKSRPCSSFDLTQPVQQKTCFNWRNLELLPREVAYGRDIEWTAETEAEWVLRMLSLGYSGELCLVFR